MIISQGRGYVFVHIPKTGGTALTLALEARAMKDDILIGDTPKAKKRKRRLGALTASGKLWKHATLADIDGIVTPEQLSQMFCFTLVRNPWDRAVSYYHWLRDQTFEHPAVALAKQVSFDAFLRDPATEAGFRQMPARRYMTAADGVEYCQKYLKIEELAQDVAPLEEHLGIKLELPHVNASRREADWRCYYDDSLEKHLADLCAEDIEKFGYRF